LIGGWVDPRVGLKDMEKRKFLNQPGLELQPLGRRPVDNIKMDLIEIRRDVTDWIDLAQDMDQWRVLLNMVMNLQVP
jgi:hypothetical protein